MMVQIILWIHINDFQYMGYKYQVQMIQLEQTFLQRKVQWFSSSPFHYSYILTDK